MNTLAQREQFDDDLLDPEDREFDVEWPKDPAEHDAFAEVVATSITDKGYCVVQMPLRNSMAAEVVNHCSKLRYGILKGEIEEDYLGFDQVDAKVAWLNYEGFSPEELEPGMRIYDIEQLAPDMRLDSYGALESCDKALTDMAALLWTQTANFEDERGFMSWGRTSTLVRASMDHRTDEGQTVRRNLLGRDDDYEYDAHLSYIESKKLSVIFMIENDGGELELKANPEAYDFIDATIPVRKGTMVVFRCDDLGMNYCYRPEGRNLALQTWVLDVPVAMKEKEEALRMLDGPEEPKGPRNNVMSVHTRIPGRGFESLAFWNMLVGGGDGQILVPIERWDVDVYYRKEQTMGYSMTCHGATVTQAEIEQFDNKFFGIDATEASYMAPYMRVCLEVGYECLYRAGHRKDDMKGWKCGVFLGDSGSDWDAVGPYFSKEAMPWRFQSRERSAASMRLSYSLGLTGPTSTSETACSSSLVACGMAQMTMRFKQPGQTTPNIAADLHHGLVIGSNSLVGPFSYISLSGPGMLTHKGRCFTFDHSADGFARGEGWGAIKLKVCETTNDAIDRVAMLIGCAINQDGRSASMTAPHGPSQQEVIRASMREAGISPNLITIAECHGTGTALGDPIEIGALRGVMRADRSVPILKTSAKSNIGHLEAAAGIAGLIKCICMLNYSCGAPNIHLLSLNPHLDVAGYPVYFETEIVDFGCNSGLSGVSSFGFGGTNARADVWGHAHHGARMSLSGAVGKTRSIMV